MELSLSLATLTEKGSLLLDIGSLDAARIFSTVLGQTLMDVSRRLIGDLCHFILPASFLFMTLYRGWSLGRDASRIAAL